MKDETAQPQLLIVDDDTVHRMVIARIGSRAGYASETAATCDDANRMIQPEAGISCITVDLSLGDRDGREVLRLIAERNVDAAVIVISGADEAVRAQTERFARQLGVRLLEVLPKPVDLKRLRDILVNARGEADHLAAA
jgi:DNA-binding NtrC family response regulator